MMPHIIIVALFLLLVAGMEWRTQRKGNGRRMNELISRAQSYAQIQERQTEKLEEIKTSIQAYKENTDGQNVHSLV